MVIKVYISGISGNKEVKKRQQRVLMILESKGIPYEVVDITEPGKEAEKDFMQTNSTSSGATVSDTNPRHPLPPQMFNDEQYCGDYDQFDLNNEIDTLEQFLKLEVPSETAKVEVNEEVQKAVTQNDIVEQMETNGLQSSREASVEAEIKTNGMDQSERIEDNLENDAISDAVNDAVSDAVIDAVSDAANDVPNLKKDLTPSEDLIISEQQSAE